MRIVPRNEKTTCKLTAVDAAQAAQPEGSQWVAQQPAGLVLAAAAYIFGGGGMLAWMLFLLMGPLAGFDWGLGQPASLLIDTLLCLLFFAQHSIMIRRRFRLWLTRIVRAEFHGALYAFASGTCLLALTLFWQPAGDPLWRPADPVRWAMLLLFLTAGAGTWWGTRALGAFDALGVRSALQAIGKRRPETIVALTIRGPYRWVRHPLYLFSLIIIWSGPVFTLDRLLHNLLWTIWIVIGARLEERDLVDCFGDAYRRYQQLVPMLLPKSLKPLMPDSVTDPQDQT
jgi:protein-S-isoprenylcysteine O-methyltransferase Ste14